jgi:hypothetical protein
MNHETKPDMGAGAGLDAGAGMSFGSGPRHHYEVECYGADGALKWRDGFDNLVTTAGKNKYLDATLKTGLAAPAWYVGLVLGPGETDYAAGDTMGSHAGWSESSTYSQANRPAFTPGTISSGSVDNSASKAVFSINGTVTISGAFMVDENTKGGTSGTLLGVGAFTGGDRSVISGDTLNVTITCTQA